MNATTQPRRVVVGYDASPGSRAALEYAVATAGIDDTVYVVHAYPRPHSWLGQPNYQRQLDVALDRAAAIVADLCAESGGPLDRVAWAPEIIGDDPAKAIAAVAAARHADEIVIGSRRAFGPLRALRGSVANTLIRLVDAPVTVIPPTVARAA
jgi:nucleotide-binding universal stress UspA family protein